MPKNFTKIGYAFKPVLLFFMALVLNLILHELSHALIAYRLGINSVMHQLSVSFDHNTASSVQNIIISVTGPVFSLCLGMLCWLAYWKISNTSIKLFVLYCAIFGVSIFSGNLFAIALGGDFHLAAKALSISQYAVYFLSFTGLILLCTYMYAIAKHLTTFTLPGITKRKVILNTIVLPWILGTALTIIVYLPMSASSMSNRISESIFWSFTLVGALRSKNVIIANNRTYSPVNWADIGLGFSLIIIVRLMANGINFIP